MKKNMKFSAFIKFFALLILTMYLSFANYRQDRIDTYFQIAVIGYFILGIYLLFLIWHGYQNYSPLFLLPSSMFLVAFFFYFPWSGIDMFVFNREYHLIFNQNLLYFQLMLMCWVGILGFQIGYGNAVPESLIKRELMSGLTIQLENFGLLPITVIILGLIGVGGTIGSLAIGSGFTYLFQNFYKWFLYLVLIIWLIRPNPINTIGLVLVGSSYFGFQWAEVTHNRSETLIPLIGIISLWNIFEFKKNKQTKSNIVFVIGTFLIIVTVFLISSQIRFLGRVDFLSLNKSYDFIVQYFTGFESTLITLSSVPSKVEFLQGKTFLTVLYQFVPSALWSAKPVGFLNADSWFTVLIMGINPKITLAIPPILAELYWNYGFWFVGVGMIGVGALYKRFDLLLFRTNSFLGLLASAAITSVALHLVRGPLGNYASRLVYEFVPFAFVFIMYSFSNRKLANDTTDYSQIIRK